MDLNLEAEDNQAVENSKIRHLLFTLGEEVFALPLSSVKEVISMVEITEVPHVPSFFKGVINLRGQIISIIDLRIKMNLKNSEIKPKQTSIIITDMNDVIIGSIVDEVNEVSGFDMNKVLTEIAMQDVRSKEYVTGILKVKDEKPIILLDFNKIISDSESKLIKDVVKTH